MPAQQDSLFWRWSKRLMWLGLLWITGVAGMGLVTLLLRALMRAVDLAL